ncbi:MAG: two-component system, NtrC family, response regulator AtoC [Thermosediminibacterales bacterium]|nr:two-component system, NtrC family, response regulator AtoC [Thermosediminibacterales bacterium]MDK2835932.1 two-component system, NtrC family, response regulator AtoC [Thermosediminibacterales bacterium]
MSEEKPPIFPGFEEIIGESYGLKQILSVLKKAAHSSKVLLLTGETGTGKELIARKIHEINPGKDKPFVAINCAAINDNLLENELFGMDGIDKKGLNKKGKFFELINGGTVFLDEIDALNPSLHDKLFKFLRENRKKSVRVIAAVDCPVKDSIKWKEFKKMLLKTVDVMTIRIPPLRERKEDIPLLVEYFLKHCDRDYHKNIRSASPEVIDIFMNYPWYGNVRELKNTVERAVAVAGECEDTLLPKHLPPHILGYRRSEKLLKDVVNFSEIEKNFINNGKRNNIKKGSFQGVTNIEQHILNGRKRSTKKGLHRSARSQTKPLLT